MLLMLFMFVCLFVCLFFVYVMCISLSVFVFYIAWICFMCILFNLFILFTLFIFFSFVYAAILCLIRYGCTLFMLPKNLIKLNVIKCN